MIDIRELVTLNLRFITIRNFTSLRVYMHLRSEVTAPFDDMFLANYAFVLTRVSSRTVLTHTCILKPEFKMHTKLSNELKYSLLMLMHDSRHLNVEHDDIDDDASHYHIEHDDRNILV